MIPLADLPTAPALLLWTLLFPTLLFVRRLFRLPSAGLDFSYLVLFYIGHAPGALLYLLPWYFTYYDGLPVIQGFQMSFIGVIAFTIGLGLVLLLLRLRNPSAHKSRLHSSPDTTLVQNPRLPWLLFGVGLVAYLVVLPFAGFIPSLTSIVFNLNNLQVVGIILGLYQGVSERNIRKVILWVALIPVLPFLTITVAGFLGFGVAAVVAILAFLITQVRFRWWHIVVGIVVVYLSLSLYVTYMRSRGEIRGAVWGGEEYATRVDTIATELGRWEGFDWRNPDHLFLIDGRLNQNFLIGVSQINLNNGLAPFANGETLQRAWLGFIPRAIWPDKPTMAGGNDIVTQYTFIKFADGTTVALGQVMEFFINFGQTGVIIGFAALGIIVGWIDSRAIHHLRNGNFYMFLRWYLPGLAMLKPLDDFSVVTTGAASALVTAFLIEFVMRRWYHRATAHPTTPPAHPQPPVRLARP